MKQKHLNFPAIEKEYYVELTHNAPYWDCRIYEKRMDLYGTSHYSLVERTCTRQTKRFYKWLAGLDEEMCIPVTIKLIRLMQSEGTLPMDDDEAVETLYVKEE